MFKKLIAVAFGAIFIVSLAVSSGVNAADNPFIKSGKAKFDEGDYRGAIADYGRAIFQLIRSLIQVRARSDSPRARQRLPRRERAGAACPMGRLGGPSGLTLKRRAQAPGRASPRICRM